MNTNDLIAKLSTQARVAAAPPALPWHGVAAAAALSLALLAGALGLRPDLAQLAATPLFWVKAGFVGVLAALGWRAALLAALPGARLHGLAAALAAACLLMAAIAAVTLLQAAPDERARQLWGTTWRSCPLIIGLMSAPILAAMLQAMRQLAPTRLRLAGALAGGAAGAIAAALYCLHCPELAPAFVGIWYVLGMLIPMALGSALGPRVLAW